MALFDRNDNRLRLRGDATAAAAAGSWTGRRTPCGAAGTRWRTPRGPERTTGGGRTAAGTRGRAAGRPMDREGGLHQRNSWSDGAWTADAAERADREWQPRNRYDRDTTQAGWRAGGMPRRDGDEPRRMDARPRVEPGRRRRVGPHRQPGGGGYDRGYRAGAGWTAAAASWTARRTPCAAAGTTWKTASTATTTTACTWAARPCAGAPAGRALRPRLHQPSDLRGYRDERATTA